MPSEAAEGKGNPTTWVPFEQGFHEPLRRNVTEPKTLGAA